METQLTFGEQLRDEGMAESQIYAHSGIVMHVDRCILLAADFSARERGGFTAEDVRKQLGTIDLLATVSKVIGARMNAAARRGLIFTKGETVIAQRPDAHARRLLVWYWKPTTTEVAA
jgi:hypothetical protein